MKKRQKCCKNEHNPEVLGFPQTFCFPGRIVESETGYYICSIRLKLGLGNTQNDSSSSHVNHLCTYC